MDNTPLSMAQRLEDSMNNLTALCKQLDEAGKNKAQALVDYERTFAIAITTRRDGGEPATLVRDLAKRDAREERLASELAEITYKSLIVKIEATKAILNARQSQNKYLAEMQ